MRYDTPIYFQRIYEGQYDPETGDYGAPQVEETCRHASVMDTGTQTMMLVFGEIRQDSKTVHLQTPFTGTFDAIRIGDVSYQVAMRRTLRHKETFVLREIAHHDADPEEEITESGETEPETAETEEVSETGTTPEVEP